MKASYKNLILFIIIKYIIFYLFLMVKNNNYGLLKLFEMKNFEDFVYYFFIFLFLPTVYIILFLLPLHYIFKLKKPLYFITLISVIFLLEYGIYTYLASTSNFTNGMYNALIGLLIFCFMFGKKIKEKFSLQDKSIE